MYYKKDNYKDLRKLDSTTQNTLINSFSGILSTIKTLSASLVSKLLQDIPKICRMHFDSSENSRIKSITPNKIHPIKPRRGEIYNAYITTGVGKELEGNHPVIIIQNDKANLYSEKVNVIPIEGDGNKINLIYNVKLTEFELESGHLDKLPSRAITSDILTLDKARLGRKIGKLNDDTMKTISKNIKNQLSL